MKELSVEEKAKRYDEAIIRGLRLWESDMITRENYEYIFPEVKESEDEKIRKALIEHFTGAHSSMYPYKGFTKKQILDWLEKQGEQKPIIEMKSPEESLGIDSDTYNKIVDECIYGEQKPDKVEPKFKVGDWVIDKQGIVHQIANVIENVTCHTYGYDIVGGGYFNDNTEGVRLWTIQDAKDGDILAVEPIYGYPSPFIAIYKERGLDYFNSHCFISFDAKFYTGDTGHDMIGIHPATKEQRDALMKAMADAGYEFDFEKKELKKIEQKPAECIQETKPNGGIVYEDFNEGDGSYKVNLAYLSKPQVEFIEDLVDSWKNSTNNTAEWSAEDEAKRNALIGLVEEIKSQHLKRLEDWDGYISWLKSLKPQTTWKPSDEMLEALYRVTPENVMEKSEDEMLLDKLYQGLKYGRVLSEN